MVVYLNGREVVVTREWAARVGVDDLVALWNATWPAERIIGTPGVDYDDSPEYLGGILLPRSYFVDVPNRTRFNLTVGHNA